MNAPKTKNSHCLGICRLRYCFNYCLQTKNSQALRLAVKRKPKIISCNLGFHGFTPITYHARWTIVKLDHVSYP